jgi:predicted RNase H-like HicB family nuclease
MKKANYHFTVVLRPEPEGGFTALVPALPGCVTYGRTLAEAKEMTKDAVSGYIESLRKHGEPVPTDSETLVTTQSKIRRQKSEVRNQKAVTEN